MKPFGDASIEALIFDLDGTIIDSEVFNLPAINAALAELAEPPIHLPESVYRGVRWSVIADHVRAARPGLADIELETFFHRHFQGLVDTEALAIPGVVGFIHSVAERVPVAIGTSSPRASAESAMARLNLRGVIKTVVAAEDYGPSEPAPDCFLLASERLGVAPERCLVFEDSPAGISAARAAGMRVVAIAHGRNTEDVAAFGAHLVLENFNHWTDEEFTCLA